MTEKDYETARELKNRLSEVVQVVDFRVFGSRARGMADEYSDMDVFLEVESLDKELKNRISDIAWEVGVGDNQNIPKSNNYYCPI